VRAKFVLPFLEAFGLGRWFFLLAEGCLSPPLTRIVDAARDRKNDLLALICSVVSVEEERTSQ